MTQARYLSNYKYVITKIRIQLGKNNMKQVINVWFYSLFSRIWIYLKIMKSKTIYTTPAEKNYIEQFLQIKSR